MSLDSKKVMRMLERYPLAFQLTHWITAVTIVVLLILIETRDLFASDDLRHQMLIWHMELGVLVVLLFLLRLIQRPFFRVIEAPDIPIPQSKRLSHAVHVVLYLLLLLAPLVGLLAKQMRGDDVPFFGFILPVFISDDVGLPYAKTTKNIHEYLGNWLMYVAMLHICAAFVHQWFFKDRLLLRMLPRFLTKEK
ncbi:hypothetical protein FERRO_11640 [Ferrovum sp. JA12]|nr:hypothetical protein FERRO_11640 [Ferrovum sp. JA12]